MAARKIEENPTQICHIEEKKSLYFLVSMIFEICRVVEFLNIVVFRERKLHVIVVEKTSLKFNLYIMFVLHNVSN